MTDSPADRQTYLRCPRGCEPVGIYQSSVTARPADSHGCRAWDHTHYVYVCQTCGFESHPHPRNIGIDEAEAAMRQQWAERRTRLEQARARCASQRR